MKQKIKSIAECGMQPTYYFEVGKRHPFPNGKVVTDITYVEERTDTKVITDRKWKIWNKDGLVAEMQNLSLIHI